MKTKTSEYTEKKVYRTLSFTFDMNNDFDRENYDLMVEFANQLATRTTELPVIDIPKHEAKRIVTNVPVKKNITSGRRSHVTKKVLELLRTGPCERDEICSVLDITVISLRTAISRLNKDGFDVRCNRTNHMYHLYE